MTDVDAIIAGTNHITNLFSAVTEGNLIRTEKILDANFPQQTFKNLASTLLHQAANNRHCNILKYLVQAGAYVDSINAQQMTALHVSAHKGDTESVKMLILYNANVNAVDYDNRTPLYYAVYGGFLDCVKALLEVKSLDLHIDRNGGWSPMHEAARFGHLECIKELIRCGSKFMSKTDDAWWTPGHMAASCGNLECLSELISHGIDVNAGAGPNHTSTLLHEASHFGHHECVELLLRSGADPTIFDGHVLPHHLASRYNQFEVLELLLKYLENHNKTCYIDVFTNVDPAANALTYHNAMHIAALYGSKECVKVLVKHNAKHLSNASDQYPLMLAASRTHIDCVKILLADINRKYRSKGRYSKDIVSASALHYLCMKTFKTNNKTIACACLLLNSRLFDVNQFDEEWVVPPCLFIAARNGAAGLVQYLLTSGADPKYCQTFTSGMLGNPIVRTCVDLLEDAKSEPKTLLLCCRLAIRREFSNFESIYDIPLPRFLQNYVFHGHYHIDGSCDFESIQ